MVIYYEFMKVTKPKLVTQRTVWDLAPLLADERETTIQNDKENVQKQVASFVHKWKDRKDYLEDLKTLKSALDDYENLHRNFGTGGATEYYFHLRSEQNQADPHVKAQYQKIDEFSKKLQNSIQFFELNLAKIPKGAQKKFLNNKALVNYKHFLEILFRQSTHLLTEPEEKILNLKSAPAYISWTKTTATLLSQEIADVLGENGKKSPKNFSEILSLVNHKNKKIRDKAAEALNNIFFKYLQIAEFEMNAILMDKKINDELKKFPRADSMRHLHDDIETQAVDSLIQSVANKFYISKNYYRLKAKLFRVNRLKYHERTISYGKINKKFTFKESAEIVYGTLRKLDENFGLIFKTFLENGQIDAFPKSGKRSGAFCSDGLLTHPTYILLNHTNQVRDVLTMAHEVGHGINSELMRQNQNALNFRVSLATAEVASTFFEDLCLQELSNAQDKETKLSIMLMKLDDDISTIFRQVAFYKFEEELHKTFRDAGYITSKTIGHIFQSHMSSYMGNAIEKSPGSENWWIYINHFRYFFYVYSYASGLLISKYLQGSVKKNPGFIEKVKQLFSRGQSASPYQSFLDVGVDISSSALWDQGLEEVEANLREAEKLAASLGKI